MKTPLIKICGITRAEDISVCEELLVDYIGFNFVPHSPRCISVEQAVKLRSLSRRMLFVGVFENQEKSFIQNIVDQVDLQYVQLHGDEPVEMVEGFSVPVIKAFRSVPEVSVLESFIDAGAKILLDGRANGEQADWNAIAKLPTRLKDHLFIAGGLNPGNVADAIETVHPFAVDAASGVEKEPGVKDEGLMRDFVSGVNLYTPSFPLPPAPSPMERGGFPRKAGSPPSSLGGRG